MTSRKPTLFLHAGLHKTGTTSLQKAFHDNRAYLADKGFCYPHTGLLDNTNTWGQHDLAYTLRDADGETLWRTLREEADAAGLPNVIVSSEELSLLPHPGLPGMKPYQLISDIFSGYDIRLLCYLRPQTEMVASLYNHHVKSVGEDREILDFLAHIAPRLDYMRYLQFAEAGLGRGTIIIRRYQKQHMNGDIISDVASQIGLELNRKFRQPTKPLNPGLTAKGFDLMLKTNRRLKGNPKRLLSERQRILAAHQAPAFYRHDLLGAEAKQTIDALFKQRNRQISRHFFGVNQDLFDPD